MKVGHIKWKLAVAKLEETVKSDQELHVTSIHHDQNHPHVFENTLKLYLQYLGVLKELEEIYNDTVHPQKRQSIQKSQILVVSRIVQLRHYFVKENPSYIRSLETTTSKDKGSKGEGRCPPLTGWEYTNIHFHRFSPQFKFKWNTALMPTIPSFFRDEMSKGRSKDQRDTLVRGYIKLKHDYNNDDDDHRHRSETSSDDTKSTVDNGVVVPPTSSPKKASNANQNKILDDYSKTEMAVIENRSAATIQKYVRGYLVRHTLKKKENMLLSMVGMEHQQGTHRQQNNAKLKDLDEKKKFQQVQNEIRYKDAVIELKGDVRRDKAFVMKELLRSARIEWATDKINETSQLPESMEEFYTDQKKKQQGIVNPRVDEELGQGVDAGADADAGAVIDTNTKSVQSLLSSLRDEVANFDATWKNDSSTGGELFDEGLAKNVAQKEIEAELQKDVDAQLISNFKRLRSLPSLCGGGTTKSSKKGDKNKSKKKAKGKKKKEKPLPGDKIAELKGMDTGHIVSVLVAEDLLQLSDDFPSMTDFICLDGVGSSTPQGTESSGSALPYPDLLQIKRLITEYCIMPMGCTTVRNNLTEEHFVRSLLLYGSPGSGKSLLAHIVARELGALFVDISPQNIPQKFVSDKMAATKLIHMVFMLAKDPTFAPIVIYMGDSEKFFLSTKKKKGIDNSFAMKFQKDLLIYKNQALTSERAIIIGSSTSPWEGDMKQMKWKSPQGKPEKQGFWEHFLYVQAPTYVERSHLWKYFIKKQLSGSTCISQKAGLLDYDVLSQYSEGYTAGDIEACVKKIITLDQLSNGSNEQMEDNLLTEIKATSPMIARETYRKFAVESMMEEKSKNKAKKKKK